MVRTTLNKKKGFVLFPHNLSSCTLTRGPERLIALPNPNTAPQCPGESGCTDVCGLAAAWQLARREFLLHNSGLPFHNVLYSEHCVMFFGKPLIKTLIILPFLLKFQVRIYFFQSTPPPLGFTLFYASTACPPTPTATSSRVPPRKNHVRRFL